MLLVKSSIMLRLQVCWVFNLESKEKHLWFKALVMLDIGHPNFSSRKGPSSLELLSSMAASTARRALTLINYWNTS